MPRKAPNRTPHIHGSGMSPGWVREILSRNGCMARLKQEWYRGRIDLREVAEARPPLPESHIPGRQHLDVCMSGDRDEKLELHRTRPGFRGTPFGCSDKQAADAATRIGRINRQRTEPASESIKEARPHSPTIRPPSRATSTSCLAIASAVSACVVRAAPSLHSPRSATSYALFTRSVNCATTASSAAMTAGDISTSITPAA